MDLEGRLLGNRYEIIEKIGNGGMATVYKAKCHVLNRYVAVKILKDEFTTDDEFIKRFGIEAQAAASLTHPNIVSIYDVGNEGNLHYIVMELIQGKTLKEIIVEEEGPLPWKWSVNVAIQIASALETAHRNKIVHRDIKPHNIIITEDGIAKVTDFGIAKAVSNSTITAFGTTIGSVHYFSPEHARGGYTDAKSDLYSLGVVMYEMLTGRVPFDADTPVSVALKHMQEEPIEPKKLNPAIPTSVNRIILKAMRKDTGLRYENATEMLKDLNMALKNPDGNFVDLPEGVDTYATQRISTIYDNSTNETQKQENKKKENKFIGFIKKHKVLSTIIGAILLFCISLGGTMLYLNTTNPKEVLLPNLVGLSKEEAEQKAKELNLVLEVTKEEYSSEYDAGKVISQDPGYAENFNIKEKTTISVVLSKGQEIVKIPKVVGKTKEEAVEELEALGLNVQVEEETSKKVEEGYVIEQDLKEGTEVNSGETITIKVSIGTGIKEVVVPSVIGKKEEDAKKELESAGLKVTIVYDENTSKNDGIVLKQSQDVGKTVEEGTEIVITVNKIEQIKSITAKINVKSLLNGKVEYEDEEQTIVKKVELKIMVGEDTVCKEKVDPTSTNITQTISGKGTVQVKVYIDDINKKTVSVNLNDSKSLTIE